ncbi:CAP domain-containing protein [Nonomuraea harbinensis]|uniref:CAP domain-containing protein n=1 Tax=Nonomuraea harbinensis TaxID=1286938 RepID=A0ABW1CAE4_9ACTN|nr:hypothetical protein [Nonomuraea harbinensis]
MRNTSYLRTAAIAAASSLALSVPAAWSSAQTPASEAAYLAKAEQQCPNENRVLEPMVDTPLGRAKYRRQQSEIEVAILCLVRTERARLGAEMHWLMPRVDLDRTLGKAGVRVKPGIGAAATRHVKDAINLRWWGKVTPSKNCIPVEDKPENCNPHINPRTGSTPQKRVEQLTNLPSHCAARGLRWQAYENTYVGWGAQSVTPRAAFDWWRNSFPHYKNMMSAGPKMSVAVAYGSADPDAGSITPAVSYVQVFGGCTR